MNTRDLDLMQSVTRQTYVSGASMKNGPESLALLGGSKELWPADRKKQLAVKVVIVGNGRPSAGTIGGKARHRPPTSNYVPLRARRFHFPNDADLKLATNSLVSAMLKR